MSWSTVPPDICIQPPLRFYTGGGTLLPLANRKAGRTSWPQYQLRTKQVLVCRVTLAILFTTSIFS